VSEIKFTEVGWSEYISWQSEDKKTLRKINNLIRGILREGALGGEGKPEKLKQSDEYSRRIDEKNRLVYQYNDGNILIMSCSGHYGDK